MTRAELRVVAAELENYAKSLLSGELPGWWSYFQNAFPLSCRFVCQELAGFPVEAWWKHRTRSHGQIVAFLSRGSARARKKVWP